jgi:hypothetical protein
MTTVAAWLITLYRKNGTFWLSYYVFIVNRIIVLTVLQYIVQMYSLSVVTGSKYAIYLNTHKLLLFAYMTKILIYAVYVPYLYCI